MCDCTAKRTVGDAFGAKKHEIVGAPSVNWDMRYDHKKTRGKMLRLFDIDRDGTFELFYRKFQFKASSTKRY